MLYAPCKQGHDSGFYGNGQCKECRRISARAYTSRKKSERGAPLPGQRGSGVCARGHVNPERGTDGSCKLCKIEEQRKRRESQPKVYKFSVKWNRGAHRVCKRGHVAVVGINCNACRLVIAAEGRLKPENKIKHKIRYDKWRAAFPEKVRAASIAWQAAHPEAMQVIRSARLAAEKDAPGRVSAAEWKAILKKFKHRCAHCGIQLNTVKNDPAQMTQDHLVPLQGEDVRGTNYAFNIVPACRACNTSKSNRIVANAQYSLFDRVLHRRDAVGSG